MVVDLKQEIWKADTVVAFPDAEIRLAHEGEVRVVQLTLEPDAMHELRTVLARYVSWEAPFEAPAWLVWLAENV